jgi:hypothetical protein
MVRQEQQMSAAGKALEAEVDSHGEWRILNTPPAEEES